MTDVFLSHSYEDNEVALRLRRELQGYKISVDTLSEVRFGKSIAESLAGAIADARVFVYLQPEHDSGSLRDEFRFAEERHFTAGLPILPVVLPGRSQARELAKYKHVRLDSEIDLFPLVTAVRSILERPSASGSSDQDQHVAFLMSLMTADLVPAPRAAAKVLDELSRTLASRQRPLHEDIELLERATAWGRTILEPSHPALTLLLANLLGALIESAQFHRADRLGRDLLDATTGVQERLRLLLLLAQVAVSNGDLELATSHFSEAYQIAPDSGDFTRVQALLGLGDIAARVGDRRRAIESYNEALRTSSGFIAPEYRAQALIGLCRLYAGSTEAAAAQLADEATWLAHTPLAAGWSEALTGAADLVRGTAEPQ